MGLRRPLATSGALAALAAVMAAAVLAVAGVSIWQLRVQAEQGARVSAENTAAALAAHAQQVFSSASYLLDGLASAIEAADVQDVDAFKRQFSGQATHALLRTQSRGFQALDVISLVAADGDLVNFSRSYPAPALNIREREGMDPAWSLQHPGELMVTAPRTAKINGRWTFYLVRQLHSRQGRMLGIVQAGIASDYFADFYQRLRVTPEAPGSFPTVLSLVRADGVVLALAPHAPQRLAQPLAELTQPGSTRALIAVRDVPGFGARVAAAMPPRTYLDAWREQATVVGGLALLSSALLTLTFVLVIRALRRREHELAVDRAMRIEAERATRAKTDFLSTITHELRTPMNGVLGMAELLLHEEHRGRQRELAQALIGSGRRLLAIINDILDLTQIEAGEATVQQGPFAPGAVAEEVRRLFADAAAAKRLSLTTEWRGTPPEAVVSDAGHLREILMRLVDNGVKFTDQGGVTLVLETLSAHGPQAVLRYAVEDTGIGIPPQAREQLFKPFAQLDASAQRRHEGTGLGLALAQRLAGLLDSRIEFEPLPGGGTRFWFELRLPVATAHELAPAAEARTAHRDDATSPGPVEGTLRPHVLVVEDNPVNAMIVQEQLRALHCTSALATDGEEALACLRDGRFDLVLMDCMLPRISGYDATTLWRAIEHTEGRHRLPIVALTANTLASNVEQCTRAGMDDFLTKPVSLERLQAVLHERVEAAG